MSYQRERERERETLAASCKVRIAFIALRAVAEITNATARVGTNAVFTFACIRGPVSLCVFACCISNGPIKYNWHILAKQLISGYVGGIKLESSILHQHGIAATTEIVHPGIVISAIKVNKNVVCSFWDSCLATSNSRAGPISQAVFAITHRNTPSEG